MAAYEARKAGAVSSNTQTSAAVGGRSITPAMLEEGRRNLRKTGSTVLAGTQPVQNPSTAPALVTSPSMSTLGSSPQERDRARTALSRKNSDDARFATDEALNNKRPAVQPGAGPLRAKDTTATDDGAANPTN
ncbi:MAG: hypothetical protein ABI041_12890 [Bdellovibrionia bacterium]